MKKIIICFVIGAAFWILPAPPELTPEAWHLLGIFIATIVGVILKPLPMGGVVLVAMTALAATHTLTLAQTFSGFTSPVIWLVVMAFFIAKGFGVTGLGDRIAYFFTGLLGKKTLGLSYGLLATDVIMAPVVPSATARAAGIIYPVLQGIAHTFESYPNCQSSRKMGAFLTVTAFQGTVITSAMFLTAMAANPLIAELTKPHGIDLSWGTWALAAIVPGICSLLVMPLVIYWLYPPEVKSTPNASKMAKEKLAKMGPLKRQEWIMLGTLIGLLVCWSFGKQLNLSTTITAMMGLCVLLLTGTLKWNTLIKEHNAWETFLWFGALLMMATSLNNLGVVGWFSGMAVTAFSDMSWQIAFPLIALIYFFSHYFFASSTAHVSAMYPALLALLLMLGAPPMLVVFVLAFTSNLYGGLTHYSLAPAPLLFGAGYVPILTWWKLGFIMGIVNILIWGTVGTMWWKFLGFW